MLYIVDVSEQCGYTIQQQAALFHSIKPLFASKPLLIVLNKIDVTPVESLSDADRATLQEMALEALKSSSPGVLSLHFLSRSVHAAEVTSRLLSTCVFHEMWRT